MDALVLACRDIFTTMKCPGSIPQFSLPRDIAAGYCRGTSHQSLSPARGC